MTATESHTGLLERAGAALDRLVSVVNPSAGAKRAEARGRIEAARALTEVVNRAHRGARHNRNLEHWNPAGRSADADNIPDLAALRNRSRDLRRNHPMAAGAVRTILTNAIRAGIHPRAHVDAALAGISEDAARDVERQLNRLWWIWERHADLGGRMSFGRLQRLVMGEQLTNGENFVVRHRMTRPQVKAPLTFCLDVVEADRVSDPASLTEDQRALVRGREIVAGVELNGNHAPVAYWVRKAHPSGYTSRFKQGRQLSNEWVRLPAYDREGNWVVRHIYAVERPGQTRGVPFFGPVIEQFHQLDDYMDAEMRAARIAACYAVFIKTTGGGVGVGSDYESLPTDLSGNKVETLYPGLISRLGPDQEIQSFEPKRPNTAFDGYVRSVMSFIGAGLGLPYHVIMANFEDMNYSNVRAAFVQADYLFKTEQAFLEEQLCAPSWEMFVRDVVEAELVNPRLMAAWYEVPDAYGARWTKPGRDAIDPTKEAQADAIALQNNFQTVTELASRGGRDIDEFIAEKAEEKREFEAAGLSYTFGKTSDRELTKEAGGGDQDDSDAEPETSDAENGMGGRNGHSHAAVR